MKRGAMFAAAIGFIAALALSVQTGAPTYAQTASTDAVPANQAVVQKYCVSCHNEKVKSGGLTLSTLDVSRAPEHAEVWEQVIRKVRTGAMPPAGRPRPDKAATENLLGYLETELDRAAFAL